MAAASQTQFDIVVIGSGPSGQKAAIQGAKCGKRVAIVELDNKCGGACVYRGTIPSKTLRENALQMMRVEQSAQGCRVTLDSDAPMTVLMSRLQAVLDGHTEIIHDQLERNGVQRIHGRAHLTSAKRLEVQRVDGSRMSLAAEIIVIATGSVPRDAEDIEVDHEHILDSDSFLSMCYLPKSLIVQGSGVIASEYASVMAILGVEVTMIDRYDMPMGFLDPDLASRFLATFEKFGGTFMPRGEISRAEWNGYSHVVVTLKNGREIQADKMLVAQGRVAALDSLRLENAGLSVNERGLLSVNGYGQTEVPNVYAAGDVIGWPALASSSMQQGRRTIRHALGMPLDAMADLVPTGIYTIPEIANVGMTEAQAEEKYGTALVGRAPFEEIARGKIAGIEDGLLKLVATPDGRRIIGVQIVGEGATELIHMGQLAIAGKMSVHAMSDCVFNFPTLAEAYTVAALNALGQLSGGNRPAREAGRQKTLA